MDGKNLKLIRPFRTTEGESLKAVTGADNLGARKDPSRETSAPNVQASLPELSYTPRPPSVRLTPLALSSLSKLAVRNDKTSTEERRKKRIKNYSLDSQSSKGVVWARNVARDILGLVESKFNAPTMNTATEAFTVSFKPKHQYSEERSAKNNVDSGSYLERLLQAKRNPVHQSVQFLSRSNILQKRMEQNHLLLETAKSLTDQHQLSEHPSRSLGFLQLEGEDMYSALRGYIKDYFALRKGLETIKDSVSTEEEFAAASSEHLEMLKLKLDSIKALESYLRHQQMQPAKDFKNENGIPLKKSSSRLTLSQLKELSKRLQKSHLEIQTPPLSRKNSRSKEGTTTDRFSASPVKEKPAVANKSSLGGFSLASSNVNQRVVAKRPSRLANIPEEQSHMFLEGDSPKRNRDDKLSLPMLAPLGPSTKPSMDHSVQVQKDKAEGEGSQKSLESRRASRQNLTGSMIKGMVKSKTPLFTLVRKPMPIHPLTSERSVEVYHLNGSSSGRNRKQFRGSRIGEPLRIESTLYKGSQLPFPLEVGSPISSIISPIQKRPKLNSFASKQIRKSNVNAGSLSKYTYISFTKPKFGSSNSTCAINRKSKEKIERERRGRR